MKMRIDEIAKTRITELEREVEALNAKVNFLKIRETKAATKNRAMIGQLVLKRIDNDYPIDF